MQDKDSYNNSTSMKCILLYDIINHPQIDQGRLNHLNEVLKLLIINWFKNDKDCKFNYIEHAKTFQMEQENVNEYKEIYNFAKLHWLIHDFKTNGMGFMPQGFLQKIVNDNEITYYPEMHPGTFRWYALMFNSLYNESILVADKENFFPEYPELTFEEFWVLSNKGFIRERKGAYSELENMQNGEKIVTVHERQNHHDWIVIKHLEELKKKFTHINVYIDEDHMREFLALKNDGIEIKSLSSKQKFSKFYIPSLEEFTGISVYIPHSLYMEDVFELPMLLHLDIDDDIVYFKDTGVIIFNNGSVGCKRLIPGIIEESKSEYLHNFLWARRIVRI